ncbi:MAG: cytochrome c3 family protein, partial [Methanocella sp.]
VTPATSFERCGRCHFGDAKGQRSGPRPTVLLSQAEWTKSAHADAKVNCTACHSVHHYAEGADQKLLRLAGDALCLSCHPKPKHAKGVASREALAKDPCVSCHNPHGPETGLLQSQVGGGKRDFKKAFVHRPVAEKKCSDCHTAHIVATAATPPEDDEEDDEATEPVQSGPAFRGLLLRPGKGFCYLCHDSYRTKFEASGHAKIVRFRQGEAQSACLGCHLPHASDYRRLLRYDGNKLCISCHPGYAPHHFLARGGVKLSQLQCVKCHVPHGTGNRRLLVQEEICRLCHNM